MAALCLIAPRSATAQITSPDQLCSPDADPCVIASAQTVANNARLDFGNRTVRITSTGRLNSTAGNLEILARELQLEASGQINLSGSTSVSGGSLSMTLAEFANIAGIINLNGQSGGFFGIEAMRLDIASTGNVLLNALESSGSGGTADITAVEFNLNGRLQLNGASDGTGGTATVQVDDILNVRGAFEVKGGDSDGGSLDLNSGANVLIADTASIRADGAGEGGGGDILIAAGDLTLGNGEGMGVLTLQGTVSSAGGGSSESGGDGGSIEISSGNDCLITGRLLAVGGPVATGGDITVQCSDGNPGDMTMSAEVDVHGTGTDGGGGSLELDALDGSITISNKINANGGTGGGGSVSVSATQSISLSDRINVNSAGGGAGDVTLSAFGEDDAIVTLTSSGSINADGSGAEGDGGTVLLEACTSRVDLRTGNAQSITTAGAAGSGTISLTGVNHISVAGKMAAGSEILFVYRDFDPFIESTAMLTPAPSLVLDESLEGCGTPQPTRTRTRTPTVPTPTPTATRPILTATPTRTSSPTPRPTPAGPDDANCNGILENDETPGVIEGTYDASFFAVCMNADANGDGRVNAADLPSIILKRTAAPPQ